MNGERYECPENDCTNSTVLVNNCGVSHTTICPQHNREMEWIEHVETKWVGINHPEDDYKIAREARVTSGDD